MTTTENKIYQCIKACEGRSAWRRGIIRYALGLWEDLCENLDYTNPDRENDYITRVACLDAFLLNGADNWSAYSWSGCAYIYNEQIVCALCTPSEIKKTRNGERRPNSREEWLDVQARALYQAARLIKNIVRNF